MLHLLSLYSLLGARGGWLQKKKKKRTQHFTGSKGPKCRSLWSKRPRWMNGQGGRAALSERVWIVLRSKVTGATQCACWVMRAASLSGAPVLLHLLWLCGTGAEAVWGESHTIRVRASHGCDNSANSLQGGVRGRGGGGRGSRKGWKHPPQLLSGDQHLGQPLQLRSLLLHGVPDPVHVCVDT